MVKKYLVKLEITNDVWVEADSPEEAEKKVLALRHPTPLTPIFLILDGARYKANVDIFSEKEIA